MSSIGNSFRGVQPTEGSNLKAKTQVLGKLNINPATLKKLAVIAGRIASHRLEEQRPASFKQKTRNLRSETQEKDHNQALNLQHEAITRLKQSIMGVREPQKIHPHVKEDNVQLIDGDEAIEGLKELKQDLIALTLQAPVNIREAILNQINLLIDIYADAKEPNVEIEAVLAEANAALNDALSNFCEYCEKEQNLPLAGPKIFSQLLHGLKQKALFSTAAKVAECLDEFQKAVASFQSKDHEISILTKDQRRQIYGHVKILQETSEELVQMQKAKKFSLFDRIFHPRKIKEHRKALKQLQERFSELKTSIDKYYAQFDFSEDEVNEFKDLSIEAHRPTRGHLIQFANDYIDGAANLAREQVVLHLLNEIETPNLKIEITKLVKDGFREMQHSQIEALIKTIEGVIENQGSKQDVRSFKQYKTRFEKELNLAADFMRKQLAPCKNWAVSRPEIGNNNPKENLSLDPKEWKKQQQDSKHVLQWMFESLKYDYVDFIDQLENVELSETLLGANVKSKYKLKDASRDLSASREEVLNSKDRWSEPIKRVLNLPRGELSSQMGKEGLQIEHRMDAVNPGYSSSSSRKRAFNDPSLMQPNFHEVTVRDPDSDFSLSYLSSATPVEFFQTDKKMRSAATEKQALEILINGGLKQIKNEGIDKPKEKGTLDDPYQVEFTAVTLLSPDHVRDLIFKIRPIRYLVNKILKKKSVQAIDASQLERRMLKESAEAMRSFAKESTKHKVGDKFTFKNSQGKEFTVTVQKNDKGATVYAMSDPMTNETKCFQFDVTFFDFGVNKWKKKMLGLGKLGGNSLEDKMNKEAWQKLHASAEVKYKAIIDERKKLIADVPIAQYSASLRTLEEKEKSARAKFIEIERNFHQVHSKFTKAERDGAFSAWQACQNELAKELDIAKKHNNPSIKEYAELTQRAFDIRSLQNEISDQFEFKEYLTPEGMYQNAYSMSSAVVALDALLKKPVWTACRSGKDRTSLQRIEIATRAAMRKIRGRMLSFREMEKDPLTYYVRQEIMLNSGHIDELAYRNIGAPGLNLSGAYGQYLKRFLPTGEVVNASFEQIVTGGVYKGFGRLK